MPLLPTKLYRAQDAQGLDAAAHALGLSAEILIHRAAHAALRCIQTQWPKAQTLSICIGPGNNGADGALLADLAIKAAYTVHCLYPHSPLAIWDAALAHTDLVVDALLGTGLNRPVSDDFAACIHRMHQHPGPILALDLPSGLCANTGNPQGTAVRATATLTFICLKPGLFTAAGPDYAGRVFFDDLQVPTSLYAGFEPCALRYTWETLPALLPRRRTLHKGECGQVLIIGGDMGMRGAVALAATAALRTGAGRVHVLTHPDHAALVNSQFPELMCYGLEDLDDLENWRSQAHVVVFGPGLGQGSFGQEIFSIVKDWDMPMVWDADALNWLSTQPNYATRRILTPHPKEAARLLESTTARVQADRFAAAKALQAQYGGSVVLKGAGTLVQHAQGTPFLCSGGNPGMASGGMGDVLTGIIAGLWAQGWTMEAAALEGVALHAHAADRAALKGERGLIASDVIAQLQDCLHIREQRGSHA